MKKLRLLFILTVLTLFIPINFSSVKTINAKADEKIMSNTYNYLNGEISLQNTFTTGERYLYLGILIDRYFPNNASLEISATVNGKKYSERLDQYSGLPKRIDDGNKVSAIVHLDHQLKQGDVITYQATLRFDNHVESTPVLQTTVTDYYVEDPSKILPTPIIHPIQEGDGIITITIPNANKIDFEQAQKNGGGIYIVTGFEIDSFGAQPPISLDPNMINEKNEITFTLQLHEQSRITNAPAFVRYSASLTGVENYGNTGNIVAYSSLVATSIVNERYPLTNYEISPPHIDEVNYTDKQITGNTKITPYYLGEKIVLSVILQREDGTKITTQILPDGSFSIPIKGLKSGEILNAYIQASYNGIVKSGPTTTKLVAPTTPIINPDSKPSPDDSSPTKNISTANFNNNHSMKNLSLPSWSVPYKSNQSLLSTRNLPRTGESRNNWLISIGIVLLLGAISYPIYQWKKNKN